MVDNSCTCGDGSVYGDDGDDDGDGDDFHGGCDGDGDSFVRASWC